MKTPNVVLISGCPRSGTSWIHFLVSSHPETVTARETHVYDKYVGPLKAWFDKEEQFKAADGLSAIFSEREFVDDILAPIVHTSFSKIASLENSNHTVVEKTPGNILHHRLVHNIQPNARLIFVARDPRAVYASFKAGSSETWGGWMKKPVADFCSTWNKYVSAYLAANSYWPENRLKLIKYESMKNSGEAELADIFNWADFKKIENLPKEALAANEIENLRHAKKGTLHHDSRSHFYRAGKAYGWVEELSFSEIKEIEEHCSDLMLLLGYQRHKLKH